MFRSWGELTRCACEVFDLFAEPISAAGHVSSTSSSHEAASAAEVGLSRVGLECAFYVLFGRYPNPSLIANCFAAAPASVSSARCTPSASPRQMPRDARGAIAAPLAWGSALASSGLGGSTRTGRRCYVTRRAYLRFVTLCADEEGEGFVTEQLQGNTAADAAATASFVEGKKAAQLQWWRQFQSVAGSKGFITAADLHGIGLQSPFSDVQEVLEGPPFMRTCDSAAAAQPKSPVSRQVPLVQHIFWMLDSDHDGNVCFDDVRPFLQEC
ncbi:hypothetical protein LSCM1_01074 [Leishmania martiniquensis]|uniref:EF-hand domain-containing protein n=1 Tax=Leishmania martiniquensis TaxID=1580590 RepID=A0A836KC55_9TRYP|nr:hypothetical protein LSCM1_01074 [Leishmania martiniquensis]